MKIVLHFIIFSTFEYIFLLLLAQDHFTKIKNDWKVQNLLINVDLTLIKLIDLQVNKINIIFNIGYGLLIYQIIITASNYLFISLKKKSISSLIVTIEYIHISQSNLIICYLTQLKLVKCKFTLARKNQILMNSTNLIKKINDKEIQEIKCRILFEALKQHSGFQQAIYIYICCCYSNNSNKQFILKLFQFGISKLIILINIDFMQSFMRIMILINFLRIGLNQNINSEDTMLKILANQRMKGTWSSNMQNMTQFNFLDLQDGEVEAYIYGYRQIQITFINGKYLENKNVLVSFVLENYKNETQSWKGDVNINIQLRKFVNTEIFYFCKGQYKIQAIQDVDSKAMINMSLVNSQDSSQYCIFNLNLSASQANDHSFINHVTFMIVFLILWIIEIIATISMITKQLPRGYKISVSTSLLHYFQILQIQMMISIQFGINQNYHSSYVVIFLLLFMIQVNSMFLFWQAWKQLFKIDSNTQCGYTCLHGLCCYVFIIVLLILNFTYFNRFMVIFLFCFSLTLYPIIIYNIRINKRENFNKIYILGHLSPKIFYFIYLRTYPQNLCGFEPKPLEVFCYILIFFFSIILLKIQQKYGSRYLIGAQQIQPEDELLEELNIQNENVQQMVQEEVQIPIDNQKVYKLRSFIYDQSDDCSICQSPLKENLEQAQQLIQTPCQHVFHYQCFLLYINSNVIMSNKLCPNCRQQLPNKL